MTYTAITLKFNHKGTLWFVPQASVAHRDLEYLSRNWTSIYIDTQLSLFQMN